MEEKPTIMMEFSSCLCSRHGEPFRANWPSGCPLFVIESFQRLLMTEEFGRETGGKQENIMPALAKKPVCCRLGPVAMLELYRFVHEQLKDHSPFKSARCHNCHGKKLGSEYRVSSFIRGVQVYRHLCFECIVHQMRPSPEMN